ncbi:YdcF family protein [Oenococcus alcoholitolerans]|uniref:YdcF family protein n=1 Tax=Oenococcus alcoholitolerans TaxID=931074 RepID=UPI003F726507
MFFLFLNNLLKIWSWPLLFFSAALICVWLFVYQVNKDFRSLKSGFFFNLSISFFILTIISIFQKIDPIIFFSSIKIIVIVFFLVLALMAYSAGKLIVWNFRLSNNTKYRARYRPAIYLAILIFAAFIFLVSLKFTNKNLPNWFDWAFAFIPAFIFYIIFVFLNFCTQTVITKLIGDQIFQQADKYNYLIVLGAGLIDGNKISPNLNKRLEKSLEFAEKNQTSRIVVSGGQGRDERLSEAQAMKNWLLKKGIEPARIILEDQSTNTAENFQNSLVLILKNKPEKYPKIAFTTNSYHLPRADFIACRNQIKAFGLPAQTPANYFSAGWFREFAAILIIKKRQHLLMLSLLTMVSIIKTLIVIGFKL